MTSNTPASPILHQQPDHRKPASTFVTVFLPGLIIGLVVGGLAGAFLTPIAESEMAGGSTKGPVITVSPGGERGDLRDERPKDVAEEQGPEKDIAKREKPGTTLPPGNPPK